MICKVKETLQKFSMLCDADEILVGFSGGADSTALIHALISLSDEFGFSVSAAHVNHCLRGEESDRDENFVRDFCDKYSIKLTVLNIDIKTGASEARKSIEEYAREVRYDFFNSLCGEKTKVATAHNLNDCEETLLFNLARGAGLKGLSSIPPVRGSIIRPLIDCSRDEIESYCKVNNLSYVTDSTNLTDDYTRNKIRHNIIPLLKEINPAFDLSALRCVSSLRDDDEYIRKNADILYVDSKLDFGFNADKINTADKVLKTRVISKILHEKCGVLPERKHIELVCGILNGGKTEVLCGETIVVRNGVLYFISDLAKNSVIKKEINFIDGTWSDDRIKIEINSDCIQKVYKELVLSTFDYDKIKGNLTLRKRNDSDKITLPVRKVTKTLKKLFNELKIPPEERDNIVIFSDDEGIVWIEKIGCDKRVAPDKNTKTYAHVLLLGEE